MVHHKSASNDYSLMYATANRKFQPRVQQYC